MKNDVLVLASGGMDSTVLIYQLRKEMRNPIILFIDYGQHCKDTELQTLKSVIPQEFKDNIRTVNIKEIYRESNSVMLHEANLWTDEVTAEEMYLPYRNLLFLSIGATYAQTMGIGYVYAAFINSNHAKEIDCSALFFSQLENLLSEYGSVKTVMPFRYLSKTEVAKLGLELGVPIELTYSCQISSKTPCGACPNCVDRLQAIKNIIKE
ncbi:MAG: 7-cyano-7-deazaguanine synthase [Erysipelotrichaceae bacterium]